MNIYYVGKAEINKSRVGKGGGKDDVLCMVWNKKEYREESNCTLLQPKLVVTT